MDDLPQIVEYGKDIQSSENYKNTFNEHIRRLLLLIIDSPHQKFSLGLAGLDTLLDPYKDEKYLKDIKKYAFDFQSKMKKIIKSENSPHRKVSDEAKAQLIFEYNLSIFRALVRLAGRANMLPIPSVTLMAGGKNPDLEVSSDEVKVSSDEIEEIEKEAKKILDEKLLKEEMEREEKLKKKLAEKKEDEKEEGKEEVSL